jgi:hypothetical protein
MPPSRKMARRCQRTEVSLKRRLLRVDRAQFIPGKLPARRDIENRPRRRNENGVRRRRFAEYLMV